jgi:hypothetical protein
MTITERIDGGRRDFIREFGSGADPFGLAISEGQLEELRLSKLARQRWGRDDQRAETYAGLVVFTFGAGIRAAGPLLLDRGQARGLIASAFIRYI